MVLKLYDDIIAEQQKEAHLCFMGTEGVSFSDIDDFIGRIPADDERIDMLIHCMGGSVSEGWAIVDKLRATGKTITATIDGTCASMAVSVLLAASERRAHKHATLHIHKPYYPEYTLADRYNEDDLRKLAEDLESETAKMLDWYVERTGADRAELAALMEEDKDIDMDEALRLGFVHSIVEPMSASTHRKNWNNSNPQEKNMDNKNTKAGVLNALASFLGLKVNIEETKPVNYVLLTQDGQELTIDKPEGEDVAVGDAASPDGEFVLEDGRTIVVVDGVVTEIRPAAEDLLHLRRLGVGAADAAAGQRGELLTVGQDIAELTAENEALKAENDALKGKIAELEAKVTELEGSQASAEDKAIVEKVNKAGGMKWLTEVAKSNYVPKQRTTTSVNTPRVSKTSERLAKLKGNK